MSSKIKYRNKRIERNFDNGIISHSIIYRVEVSYRGRISGKQNESACILTAF